MKRTNHLARTLLTLSLFMGGALSRPAEAGRLGSGAEDDAPPRRFALVVGFNGTSSPDQRALRFADDDAAKVAELLDEAGVDTELLTTFDHDSQVLYAQHVGVEAPTRANVMARAKQLTRRMEAASRAGERVELLVYYSGHGDVGPDGQGFLTLDGGKLTRHDLFGTLIGESPADHNHVIIDACESEELILARGEYKPDRAGPEHRRAVADYLGRNHASVFRNTGFIIASSVDQQTHEWSRYRGGIFTHEVVSGLRGGADINGDGRVEYSELGAFVSAANQGVTDPRAKLRVVVRPPANDERAPMLVHSDVSARRVLYFDGRGDGRYAIEDGRGVRLADVRRASGRPFYLRVPEGPLFVYETDQRGEVVREAGVGEAGSGILDVRRLAFVAREREAKGALDEAFREGLFSVPYGSGYYAGFTGTEGMLGVAEPEWEVRVWKREDGEMVEVARVEVEEHEDEDDDLGEQIEEAVEEAVEDALDEDEHGHSHWDRAWGSFSLGMEMTPFSPTGSIRLGSSHRVIANEFPGFPGEGFPRMLRGFDLRWGGFSARDRNDRPGFEGWFRTGYTQGYAEFLPVDDDLGFEQDQPVGMKYLTVPLWFTGNFYAFKRWPVRPYAGMGAGFDILRVDYARSGLENLVDVSARIGFELHAGIEARINNYIGFFGEVRQVWSARRKLPVVPDFSNEGATLVVGIKTAVPLRKRLRRHRHGDRAIIDVHYSESDDDEAEDADETERAAEAAGETEASEEPAIAPVAPSSEEPDAPATPAVAPAPDVRVPGSEVEAPPAPAAPR